MAHGIRLGTPRVHPGPTAGDWARAGTAPTPHQAASRWATNTPTSTVQARSLGPRDDARAGAPCPRAAQAIAAESRPGQAGEAPAAAAAWSRPDRAGKAPADVRTGRVDDRGAQTGTGATRARTGRTCASGTGHAGASAA